MPKLSTTAHLEPQSPAPQRAWLAAVQKAAASVRFGFIQIKIHDGAIVQIEATEKYRLEDFSLQPDSSPTENSEA